MATEVQAVELTEEMVEAAPGQREAARERAKPKAAGQGLGYRAVKRAFDIVASLCALILLSPVFLIVAAAIKLDSKGPVIFKHKRIGQNGKPLLLYKFRSMFANAEELKQQFTPEQKQEFEKNYKLEDDPRITKVGSFIRKTSLDELPQLVNILQGNLSLVGPRPLVTGEIEKYGVQKDKFLSVKPGLTGYWQVNGRSAITYEDRIRMELYYVERASILLDIKVIFQTMGVVLKCRGAK